MAGLLVGGERLGQLLLQELALNVLAVLLLGEAGLLEGGLPLLVVLVVRLRLVHDVVDLGALDGYVLLLSALLDEFLLSE